MKKTLSLLLVFSLLLAGCSIFPTSSPAEAEPAEESAPVEEVQVQSAAPETADEGLAAPQSAGTATLFINPANTTVNVGQTFNVTVQVSAGTQEVNTVQASLNFDPTYLEAVTTTQVGNLSSVVQNEVDNAAGTIKYAAAINGGTVTGEISVVQINFKAKAAVPSTAINFETTGTLKSDVLNAGVSVLAGTTGATVAINSGGVTPPTSTPSPGSPTATPYVPGTGTSYIVQAGDNLYRIGLKFGIPWTTIQSYNNLPSTLIYVGQVLQIPGGGYVPTTSPTLIPGNTTHTVQVGENLFRIGLMYGVQWPAIMAHNGLTSTLIYPGQILKIP